MQSNDKPEYAGTGELVTIEAVLPNYNRYIIQTFFRYFGDTYTTNKKIIDFGAGVGALANLAMDEFNHRVICVELDPNLRRVLITRGYETYENILGFREEIDFVFSSNVLEHIQDDVSALKDIHNSLKPNGVIALYVPALPFLFSEFDRKVGHCRRYKRRELCQKLEQSGFIVEHAFYSDSLGVLLWSLVKILKVSGGESSRNSRFAKLYDRAIFPLSRFLDEILFKRLIGKNIFVIAKKK